MIGAWRDEAKALRPGPSTGDLPFVFVQIAPVPPQPTSLSFLPLILAVIR